MGLGGWGFRGNECSTIVHVAESAHTCATLLVLIINILLGRKSRFLTEKNLDFPFNAMISNDRHGHWTNSGH